MALVSLGSDMELFAKNNLGNHVALCGKIGGTKEEPLPLPELGNGFMIQEDNVAFEFNVPCAQTKTAWVRNFKAMRSKVSSILKALDLKIATEASVSFNTNELKHPNALVFGCEPDYDAWKAIENKKPTAIDANLRTAGGHIHVGTKVGMLTGVKLMDLYLGVPSVILDNTPASKARRELYGKAGAMRPKPYGFEYRTLSNFWMFNDKLTAWVFTNTAKAMTKENIVFTPELSERIQTCINTGDVDMAKAIITEFEIPMPTKVKTETF